MLLAVEVTVTVDPVYVSTLVNEAVAVLARLSTTNTLFNSLNHAILSRPGVSKRLYPMFKAARRLALVLTGKTRLVNPLNSTGLPHK